MSPLSLGYIIIFRLDSQCNYLDRDL